MYLGPRLMRGDVLGRGHKQPMTGKSIGAEDVPPCPCPWDVVAFDSILHHELITPISLLRTIDCPPEIFPPCPWLCLHCRYSSEPV